MADTVRLIGKLTRDACVLRTLAEEYRPLQLGEQFELLAQSLDALRTVVERLGAPPVEEADGA